jgi:hypothetical protein
VDGFVGIDESIYQRIGQRNEHEEDEHALVAEGCAEFPFPYIEQVMNALYHFLSEGQVFH